LSTKVEQVIRFLHVAAGLLILAACAGVAEAEDSSPWQSGGHSAVRLLAGSRSSAVLLGGIEFRLQPGWKTYWRNPGDSGVAPRFDFSASENVGDVAVLWPAPNAFPDGAGGTSLGFALGTILPLRISPKAADRPVILRASVSYAVCEKLCIPVEATLELVFASVVSSNDAALLSALANVPKPGAIGDNAPLAIRSVRRDGQRVAVEVRAPPESKVELYVEGPSPDWSLPIPRLETRDTETLRFGFELDGLPPGAQASGAELKFTLVGADLAREITVRLD
jgi:DsbC/DsbD-like thiol-disulfide interchange protein